jgi:hypothetical protein
MPLLECVIGQALPPILVFAVEVAKVVRRNGRTHASRVD